MAEIIHVDFGAELKLGDEIEIPDWDGLWKVTAFLPGGEIEVEEVIKP